PVTRTGSAAGQLRQHADHRVHRPRPENVRVVVIGRRDPFGEVVLGSVHGQDGSRDAARATAAAAPARAAPPADAATSHLVSRGSSLQDAALAATSRASDRAPAPTQAAAWPESAAGPCRAARAPRPRARSRAPRAPPNTRADRLPPQPPTHGRAGTERQPRAVTPGPTSPAATHTAPSL